MTVTEAAEYLGLSRSTVYELCTAKLIRHRRAGTRRGRIDITREWCDEYLKAGEIAPVGEVLQQASPEPPMPTRRETITMTDAERERLNRRRKSRGAA